jgi:S-formylglutathione hydrolase FrmB
VVSARRGSTRLAIALLLVLSACTGDGNEGSSVRVESFDIRSELMGMTLHESGLEPAALPGGVRRPLLVFLHGYGGTPAGLARAIDWDEVLGALGDRAPAVVIVDGGRGRSYYHDRAGAPWGRHILNEVIPQAAERLHADPHRVAIGGISMGGFGALDLGRQHPGRFCAVGGHSPALLRRFEDTRPGAFDDAADFGRHDLFAYATANRDPFPGVPVWLDVGVGDPYAPTVLAFDTLLEAGETDVAFQTGAGGHDDDYWRAHFPEYLEFYAAALDRCD